jgi:hypothetical protein
MGDAKEVCRVLDANEYLKRKRVEKFFAFSLRDLLSTRCRC